MLFKLKVKRPTRGQVATREVAGTVFPFAIPGMRCSRCSETWAQVGAVPLVCPVEYRKLLKETGRWPIPSQQHHALTSRLEAAMGLPRGALLPGNMLFPCVLSGPDEQVDMLPAFPNSIVVSRRFKDELERSGVKGGFFFEPVVVPEGPGETAEARLQTAVEMACSGQSSLRGGGRTILLPVAAPSVGVRFAETVVCDHCGYSTYEALSADTVSEVMARVDMARFLGGLGTVISERMRDLMARQRTALFEPIPMENISG